jgi:hypothetical protein
MSISYSGIASCLITREIKQIHPPRQAHPPMKIS